MLVVTYVIPSNVRTLSILMLQVLTGRSVVSFEGHGPEGPARFAKIRSGRYINSPIIGLVDGILWNEDLVPIMNQISATPLPYLEMLGNIVSLVALLESD